jgi:hypothetical protein
MDRLDNRNLMIFNNSNKLIYNIISPNDSINVLGYYNDFIYKGNNIYLKKGNIKMFVFIGINPKEKLPSNDRPNKWDLYFESINDKKMRLFIIEKDSVDKYGWKEIFKKNIYNKKYLLTIKDLNSLNWTITYDGN